MHEYFFCRISLIYFESTHVNFRLPVGIVDFNVSMAWINIETKSGEIPYKSQYSAALWGHVRSPQNVPIRQLYRF